jgi:hypothetical protein
MSAHVIIVDAVAILLVLAGFHLAFRQRLVRRWWRAWGGRGALARPERAEGEDPVHYAMIIFGMMLFAFGLILFAFTTFYAVLTT